MSHKRFLINIYPCRQRKYHVFLLLLNCEGKKKGFSYPINGWEWSRVREICFPKVSIYLWTSWRVENLCKRKE